MITELLKDKLRTLTNPLLKLVYLMVAAIGLVVSLCYMGFMQLANIRPVILVLVFVVLVVLLTVIYGNSVGEYIRWKLQQ